MCSSWPRQTFPTIFLGSIVEMIGIGLLAWGIYSEHDATVYGMMAVAGVGIGLRLMPGKPPASSPGRDSTANAQQALFTASATSPRKSQP